GQPPEVDEPRRSSSLQANPPIANALSEFETHVSELAGVPIQRLGSNLMLPSKSVAAVEANRQVPPDYIVGLGDEIQ
ncbi:hypothetical protein, partial [Proteus mirabilis]|uniref:hypothetical protein n=1 Tax=Proteus mirabilis TaxID=584 RepID=UPI0013CFCB85